MSWFSILKTDAEDRAMQLIEETVEGLSYAEIVDDEIWLTPDWMEDLDEINGFHLTRSNRKIDRFVIKLDEVHKPKLCVYLKYSSYGDVNPNSKFHEGLRLLCLSVGKNPLGAVPADSYVTVMMLMGNKEAFLRLWD